MEYGEKWPGATSNRFPSNRKPMPLPSEFLSPPNGLLAFSAASLEKVSTRRHFEEKFGTVAADRKLSFRKIAKSLALERARGMKHIDPQFTVRKPRPEKGHIRQELPTSNRPEMPMHMHMVRNAAGQRPQDCPSSDFDFHITQIGRKGHVADSRNGIPQFHPGDKLYSVVDYAPEFFKHDGLMPTCIYRVRPPRIDKSASGVFKTLQSYDATHPPRVKWTEKLKRVASEEMHNDVKSLVEWYMLHRERTTLKEIYPNLPDPEATDEDNP